ncbi:MAG: transglutaminase-like domain-containing protein [Ruminococcus sp.]|nr:transglutaminase-like domain-containing protein [Ruminococcus sp.]
MRLFNGGKADDMPRDTQKTLPLSVSMGMHISAYDTRPVYFIMRSLIALCGIFGSVFSFVTACENSGYPLFDKDERAGIACAMILSWIYFSFAFAVSERYQTLSKILARLGGLGVIAVSVMFAADFAAGAAALINDFSSAVYPALKDDPVFEISSEYAHVSGSGFFCLLTVLISMLACCTVKRPNIIVFAAAVIPLAELCLYFGMVPDRACFILLAASLAGQLAAELARCGMFADPGAERIFTKTASQSAISAAAIVLLSFLGASVFMNASGFSRSEKADALRNRVIEYMKTFSWEKFSNDISASLIPDLSKQVTHDGRLGTTGSVEFTGEKMIDVTLPADAANLYLKGFNGTEYTGTRWNEGEAMPPLETKITSPEFFGGRALKCIPEYADLKARFVVIRTSGMSENMRYYPVNGAGLLETDGIRRRYGVYFPDDVNWRSRVIDSAASITLPEDMARDEKKMRAYAYTYCLDVPQTFTAYEDFFLDFEGGDVNGCLNFIRNKLGRDYTYTLEAGRKPFGADFAQWFLTENKKGSCTHFASSAVLLCRSMGIPARYCEGFVIKREDIEAFAVPGEEYVTLTVPDSRSHAWAEIYADGFGWVSFEVTPGYGNIAVNLAYGETDWENAVTSEITSVTTEAPAFTEELFAASYSAAEESSVIPSAENRASSSETEAYEEMIASEDSDMTETQTVQAETYTVAAEADVSDTPEASHNNEEDLFESGGYGENGIAEQTESETVTAAASEEESGADTEHSEKADTEEDGGEITEGKKRLSPAARLAAEMILTALLAAGVCLAARQAVKLIRRTALERSPNKAAVKIYRMTAVIGQMGGCSDVPPEDLPGAIVGTFGFGERETEIIVSCALKARFGGGVTPEEAKKSAESYNSFIAPALGQLGALKRAAAFAAVLNRYHTH